MKSDRYRFIEATASLYGSVVYRFVPNLISTVYWSSRNMEAEFYRKNWGLRYDI
jgi:phosphomevalonate kinase